MSEQSGGGIRSTRPGLWLAIVIIAELAGIVWVPLSGAPAGGNGVIIGVILLILLWPIRRGHRWAWQVFVTLQCVVLALVPVFIILVLVIPGGELFIDWGTIVTSIVALTAITAPALRPARADPVP
ncbi:hypothetical protein [Glaciibacter psychrotolerans]|uniref:Uncharacterized protein n=1 Tax=Glaciibacter psychrotolerans TaxID=670054 RepID=A0A7Z0EFW6_9MICO|nr:hypothetical protein [Leifsonia psychrotolerans]NYJ20922.1 hypothetical protein [Leifsonia psychrotolerans]